MIEPATAIRGGPVFIAVAPPAVEFLVVWGEGAHCVTPAAAFRKQAVELIDLNRRVADDFQQLLVRPHIMLQRRDVEIAEDDDFAIGFHILFRPVAHGIDKAEFFIELLVHFGVGHIAARGHIEVVDDDAVLKLRRDMALVAVADHVMRRDQLQREFGEDGDAVVAFLAGEHDVLVAKAAHDAVREQRIIHLRFLQAEDIRRVAGDEARQQRLADADGVDIPGSDGDRHGA